MTVTNKELAQHFLSTPHPTTPHHTPPHWHNRGEGEEGNKEKEGWRRDGMRCDPARESGVGGVGTIRCLEKRKLRERETGTRHTMQAMLSCLYDIVMTHTKNTKKELDWYNSFYPTMKL